MIGHDVGVGAPCAGRKLVEEEMEESVMRMVHLEHQAQMTFNAVSAFGTNHPSIPDELLEEMATAPPHSVLPHFKDRLAQISPMRRLGLWPHLQEMAMQGM